jgi:hypothetical protein
MKNIECLDMMYVTSKLGRFTGQFRRADGRLICAAGGVVEIEYEAPQISVCGVFLCENVADTVFSPVKKADVEPWTDGGETTEVEGGDVWLAL